MDIDGVFVNNRRYEQGAAGVIVDYFIDAPADIAKLPGTDQIKETSTAFCPATGQVWALMTAGWVPV